MAAEGAPLSVAVKLDLMLQVARGLEALKDARVLWRDLKAKNLLVADVWRAAAAEVTKVSVKFTDWGTAVKMPRTDEAEPPAHDAARPGHRGYIAPDTRGPMYDYQADMWAYLVWAASMCLTVACVVDCQLEEALAGLAAGEEGQRHRRARGEGGGGAVGVRGGREGGTGATRCSSSSRPLRPGWTRSCAGPRRRRRRSSSSSAATTRSRCAPGRGTKKSLIR